MIGGKRMGSRQLKTQLRGTKNELANYKRRKEQLERIRDGYLVFDDYALDLNEDCTLASSNSSSGIVILGGSNDPGKIWSKKDNGSYDGQLLESKNYTNLEIQRVEQKITDLNSKIGNLESEIEQAEKQENNKKK